MKHIASTHLLFLLLGCIILLTPTRAAEHSSRDLIPSVDGTLTDPEYSILGLKQNSNAGFGPNIDVSKIVYFSDVVNQIIYIGVVGKFDVGSNNAIGIFLDVTGTGSPSGKASGQALGIQSGGGSYIGANNDPANVNFKADFEVDYMLAFNPGGGATNVYFDAAKHVTSSVIEYQGTCNQTGTSATNSNASGTVFPQNSISFAVNNSGGANTGIELAIPWSSVGANGNMQIQVFAFVVSSTAFFSDVTVPGNAPTAGDVNPGFNADFSTLAGGPYHTNPSSPLPIQLSYFNATRYAQHNVILRWRTMSEINNYGFEVQKRLSSSGSMFMTIGFVPGNGTTNDPHTYSFVDATAEPQALLYRLRQIDLDGTIQYSEAVHVDGITNVQETAPRQFSLSQNYPNPFNPSTEIKFSVDNTSRTILDVYNMLGQKVATLFDDVAEAGQYYKVRFDAAYAASGMYFYKLQNGEKSDIKKMSLVK